MNTFWKKSTIIPLIAVIAGAVARGQENDAAKKALSQLQGEWTLVSGTNDGSPLPPQMLASGRRICLGNSVTLMNGTQMVMKATMIIDPSKKPQRLDYQVNEGPSKGRKRMGIYELNGDSFKSCFGAPDAPRPKEFASKQGDGHVLTTWKRVKK